MLPFLLLKNKLNKIKKPRLQYREKTYFQLILLKLWTVQYNKTLL